MATRLEVDKKVLGNVLAGAWVVELIALFCLGDSLRLDRLIVLATIFVVTEVAFIWCRRTQNK